METRGRLADIAAAETRLGTTVEGFSDSDLRAPSLCEGWTRGHVLAHIALNADSVVNLFEWARTGEETPQYPSVEARAADIERYSTRTTSEHRAALDESTERFHAAARRLTTEQWDVPVRGIGGAPQPVGTYLFGRLREVEVHHVDLDASYTSADWPGSFVRDALLGVPDRLGSKIDRPFEIDAVDLHLSLAIGDGPTSSRIEGRAHDLLLWFLRGVTENLQSSDGSLPSLPSWG